jgi:5'(3')-deoxyribonucleotidase
MRKPEVLLDCDGVVFDFHQEAALLIEEFTNCAPISPDRFIEWEVFDCLPEYRLLRDKVYGVVKAPGGCTRIPVYPGAIEGVQRLREVANVTFVTAQFRGSLTWMGEREAAILKYFKSDDVIFTHKKFMVRGDILVDDKPSHVIEWQEANPQGQAWVWPHLHNKGTHLNRLGGWEALYQLARRFSS